MEKAIKQVENISNKRYVADYTDNKVVGLLSFDGVCNSWGLVGHKLSGTFHSYDEAFKVLRNPKKR